MRPEDRMHYEKAMINLLSIHVAHIHRITFYILAANARLTRLLDRTGRWGTRLNGYQSRHNTVQCHTAVRQTSNGHLLCEEMSRDHKRSDEVNSSPTEAEPRQSPAETAPPLPPSTASNSNTDSHASTNTHATSSSSVEQASNAQSEPTLLDLNSRWS